MKGTESSSGDRGADSPAGERGTCEVGRAYRCADGIVRWVTHRSRRGYFHLLWLEEERGVWFDGGKMKRGDATFAAFEGAAHYPAPGPGETYTKIGVYGHPRELRVEEPEAGPEAGR